MTGSVWIRPVGFVSAILFLISWLFPVGAGLAKDTLAFPKWWGAADVCLAFVLAIVAFGIQAHARGQVDRQVEVTSYRVYRTVTHGLIVVAGVAMLAGDRISWANCAADCPIRANVVFCALSFLSVAMSWSVIRCLPR